MIEKRLHPRQSDSRAFALIVTVALVAMVALLVLGLAAIGRVEIQAQSNAQTATQARRNALFALQLAVAQLQRFASQDDTLTIRADFQGAMATNGNWTAVASSVSGVPVVWLVNGPEQGALVNPTSALSAPASRSSPTVQLLRRALIAAEQVTVVKSEIRGFVPALGESKATGRYAYWVSDESLKVSMGVRTDLAPVFGLVAYPSPRVETIFPLLNLAGTNSTREKLVVTDQALLISGVTAPTLNSNWPHVTACSRGVDGGGGFVTGAFNVNSRSPVAWRAMLGAVSPAPNFTVVLAALNSTPRPFLNLDDFGSRLGVALGGGGMIEAQRIRDGLRPLLVVRGDTFLVRAYGETLNPLRDAGDSDFVTATAMCEAMVQRTVEPGVGFKYVVTYLRWLGPGEI